VEARSYTHQDIAITANRVGELLSLELGDRICLSLPLHTELAHAIGIWSALTHGAFVVLPTEFYDSEVHLKTISEEYCNTWITTPSYLSDILKSPNLTKFPLSKLKKTLVVSEETVPIELLQPLKDLNIHTITMNPREKVQGKLL